MSNMIDWKKLRDALASAALVLFFVSAIATLFVLFVYTTFYTDWIGFGVGILIAMFMILTFIFYTDD